MYILKIKGSAKIPDYIQIRDDDFTLVAYFRHDRHEQGLKKFGSGKKIEEITAIINDLPYGKIQKILFQP
jgi:hypothetical protein